MRRNPVWLLILLTVLAVGLPGIGAREKPISREQMIPTLETALHQLAAAAEQALPDIEARAFRLGLAWDKGRVRVVVEAGDPLPLVAIARLGGEIVARADALALLEVDIPIVNLINLALLPGVTFVRRPHRPIPLGVSEGVGLSRARAWHAAGFLGQGIRVAVIDMDFEGYDDALLAGELNNVIHIFDYTGWGMETGCVHGTACAQIVHDMAPQAELLLMKINSGVQLSQAVDDAIAHGVDVITHSVGWFNTNFYDGTGVIASIAESAMRHGILWVNAAGNSADRGHWEGSWRDADADGWLDFAWGDETNRFHLPAGAEVRLWLTWDAWPLADQDYNLYLVDAWGNIVASSLNWQTGTQAPAESIGYRSTFGGFYSIKIHAVDAPAAPRLELFTSRGILLAHAVAGSSIVAPGNAPFVLTVGAINITQAAWETGPQADYSSQGPTNRSRFASPIVKPDIVGPSGLSGTAAGLVFSGTSAAAPHVAGAAALVWSQYPGWSATAVRGWLEENAVDMGSPGKDNLFGHGRLDLPLDDLVAPPPDPDPPASHTYGTVAGWYMVSVPHGGTAADLFGTTAWRWDPATETYVAAAIIEPSRGYWVHLPANKVVTDTGAPVVTNVTIDISVVGWHQISSPWIYPKDAISVTRGPVVKTWSEAVAAGWVRGNIYGFKATDGFYTTPTVLHPWYGYWMRAEVSGLSLWLHYVPLLVATVLDAPMAITPDDLPPPPPITPPAADLTFGHFPNPVVDTTTFVVTGATADRVEALKVRIFSLDGRLVYQREEAGASILWQPVDNDGEILANGVYLYRLYAQVGDDWVTSDLKILTILR